MKIATRKLLLGLCPAAAAMLAGLPARAQGATDEAAAVALFNEAKALVAAGDAAHACPKFVEVKKTLPTAGLLLNLGDCFERIGKLASAWAEFKAAERAAQAAHDEDRAAEGLRRAVALEPRLSKLTITVGDAERLPGLTARRDNAEIGEGQWGSAVPVDAGEHVIEVSAPGHRAWSTKVTLGGDGATASVAVPRLVPEEKEPRGPGSGPEPGAPWWTGQRITGAAVGGVGVVGLVIGAVFGVKALQTSADSKASCYPTDPNVCSPVGASLRHDAFTFAHVSTGTLVGGGVALAAGVVLLALPPAAGALPSAGKVQASPMVGPGVGGIAVRGFF